MERQRNSSVDPYKLIRTKKPCDKIIKTSPFEQTSPEMQKWWWKKFQSMEDRASMPFHNRIYHLQECFSLETVQALIRNGIEIQEDPKRKMKKDRPTKFVRKTVHCFDPAEWRELCERPKVKKKPYSNPYINFMNKSDADARIWRPKEAIPEEQLPLIEKAKILEEKIAKNFDDWFNAISPTKSEIDKNIILSIFEMVFSYPIMTSVFIKTEELGTVPEVTAKFLGSMKHSDCACVRREIRRDIKAAQRKPRYVAFNTALPEELQRKRFTEDLNAKWFEYQIRHNDLETMATVWRNITQLKTTQGFVNWLYSHPQIPIPPYLEQAMAEQRYVAKKSEFDITDIEEDSDWNLTTLHAADQAVQPDQPDQSEQLEHPDQPDQQT